MNKLFENYKYSLIWYEDLYSKLTDPKLNNSLLKKNSFLDLIIDEIAARISREKRNNRNSLYSPTMSTYEFALYITMGLYEEEYPDVSSVLKVYDCLFLIEDLLGIEIYDNDRPDKADIIEKYITTKEHTKGLKITKQDILKYQTDYKDWWTKYKNNHLYKL